MKLLPSTVINFHAVSNKSWFEKTLLLLSSLYKFVSIDELHNFYCNKVKLKHICHLTFDDGDKSFYDVVYPLLMKYQIPASIYISPLATVKNENFWFQEIIGYNEDVLKEIILQVRKSNGLTEFSSEDINVKVLLKSMSIDIIWESIDSYRRITNTKPKKGMNLNLHQVHEIAKSGIITVGAHTQRHPILANESGNIAEKEILESIADLSNILGKDILCFAYPNGQPIIDFGEREKKILAKSSVRIAFSTVSKTISSEDDRLSVPRNGISSGGRTFVAIKLVAGSKWGSMKKLLHGKQEGDFRRMTNDEDKTTI
ncbi:MAG: polysaccharide deacetylase family protein [Proteiniphilum sp.]|nr:polysaccharide deacetylase family protein [Proteiniphilum sp.]